jgi:hypothetical protein
MFLPEGPMTDRTTLTPYLEAEIEALEPLEFLALAPGHNPLHVLELLRAEDGALQLHVPGRPPIAPELPVEVHSRLRDLGFTSEDAADRNKPWTLEAGTAAEAVDLAYRVLGQAFGEKPDVSLDVVHGSRKAEREAEKKLADLREQIRGLLLEINEGPCECDSDQDFTIPVGDVQVIVAPRLIPGGVTVVRVFCVTNVGFTVTPELGLFLARLNFDLMFGRFALDAERNAIWFDEILLGDQLSKEVLRFTMKVVAATADEWDDRIKQMFGGSTYQDVIQKRVVSEVPNIKPGVGGYL